MPNAFHFSWINAFSTLFIYVILLFVSCSALLRTDTTATTLSLVGSSWACGPIVSGPFLPEKIVAWQSGKPEYVEDKDLALSHDWDRKVGENMTSFVIASFFSKIQVLCQARTWMKHLKDSFLRGLLKAGNSLFLELKWHYDAKDIRVNRIK